MAKKKTSRKELLKGPDEFITFSSRAADFINSHMQQLRYVGYAIVAIIIAYFASYLWMGSVNKVGQTAYNAAADDMRNWMMKPDQDMAAIKKSGELFSEVIENQGMSKAARLAIPLSAYIKFNEKDYPEAISLYRQFLDEFSGDAQYEALARLALASCSEASGDMKAAIEILSPMVAVTSTPFRETAIWNLARLHGLDKSPDKADTMLKQLIEEYEGSSYSAMAKARL